MGVLSAQIASAKFSNISINKLLDGLNPPPNISKSYSHLTKLINLAATLISYRKAVNFGNLNLIRHNIQADTVASVEAVSFK